MVTGMPGNDQPINRHGGSGARFLRVSAPLLVLVVATALLFATAAPARPRVAAWTTVREARSDGVVSAVFSYDKQVDAYGLTEYRNAYLEVARAGRTIFSHAICRAASGKCGPYFKGGLSLRNIWATPEPEVVVDLFTGGAHCCEVSAIVLYQGGHGRFLEHVWSGGYRGQYRGSAYYFLAGDDRFDYEFTDHADSALPIAVWSFNGVGHLVDVTRVRLDLVSADAKSLYASYTSLRSRTDVDVRGVVAAWCAEEYVLGDGPTCEGELKTGLSYGIFAHGPSGVGPKGLAYVNLLEKDLARWGYER